MIFGEMGVGSVIAVYYGAAALGFLVYRCLWRGRGVAGRPNPGKPVEDNLWLIFSFGLNPVFGALLFPVFWPLVLALQLFFRWLPDGVLAENVQENRETVMDRDHRSGLERRVGESGRAVGDLRPAGRVEVGGEMLEACSDGGFISKDERVVVIGTDGFRLRVKKREDHAGEDGGFTRQPS